MGYRRQMWGYLGTDYITITFVLKNLWNDLESCPKAATWGQVWDLSFFPMITIAHKLCLTVLHDLEVYKDSFFWGKNSRFLSPFVRLQLEHCQLYICHDIVWKN